MGNPMSFWTTLQPMTFTRNLDHNQIYLKTLINSTLISLLRGKNLRHGEQTVVKINKGKITKNKV